MKRWLIPMACLAVLGGLIGWRLQTKRAEAAAQAKQRQDRGKARVSVATAPAAVRDIVETFDSVGSVESPFNVRIASKTSGRVSEVTVREGARVAVGQVLVRIDQAEAEANVRQAEAALAEARFRLAQARLNQDPTNVNVAAEVRKQQASVGSARADLRQAKENARSSVAAAEASVTDAQGRASAAQASVGSAQASVGSAEANLANARAKLARVQELHRQRYIAAQDLDDAKTAVSVQQGNLEVAKGQLASAQAQLASARAQRAVADRQLEIARAKSNADVEAAQARATQASASLSVAQANRAQRPAFRENLAALASVVAATEAALRSSQARLSDYTLVSPIDGYVTARSMDPGGMATPGQAILVVQSLRQLWATVPVPEEVVRKMRLGMPAEVKFDALPGRAYSGRITQINPAADPTSRQFDARVTLDNPRAEIKPGMFARIAFETERVPGAIVVPREAVQNDRGGAYVTVVGADGATERRTVTTSASDPNGVAVRAGLQAGEKVVVLSATPVKPGTAVRAGGGPPGARRRGGGPEGGAR